MWRRRKLRCRRRKGQCGGEKKEKSETQEKSGQRQNECEDGLNLQHASSIPPSIPPSIHPPPRPRSALTLPHPTHELTTADMNASKLEKLGRGACSEDRVPAPLAAQRAWQASLCQLGFPSPFPPHGVSRDVCASVF
ncbi:unnamed protein product [Pleuronectes platessa]|uniref:Uncharacterized protein n=1 Tax=Pleuronectes platessa TaxID=8262 RepID=A0A9N7UEX1_PLEPL|nr:unnamed protein product [Pleuronectes platessa]